ncbi:reverse transcriptase domain-containing protein [Tanacetum coccineum]
MLTTPIKGQVLVMYLTALTESVSVVLLAERKERQVPIYFVSRVLQGAETTHNWRSSVILADFLAETPSVEDKVTKTKETEAAKEVLHLGNTWKLYTDGALSSDGSGVGLMLISLKGKVYTYALRFEFETTNNEAKYEALLVGLRIVEEMEIKDLAIFIDSQLVANQVKGLFEARQPVIKQYFEKTKEVLKYFDTYLMEHIQRYQNKKANSLSNLASMTFEHLTNEVLVEVLANRLINSKEVSKITVEDDPNL